MDNLTHPAMNSVHSSVSRFHMLQRHMQTTGEKRTSGLLLALGLSFVFMLLSFLRTWGDMGSAAFGGRILNSTLQHPILGTRLGLRLMGFAAAVLFVHLMLGLAGWILAHTSRSLWPNIKNGLRAWSSLWVLILAGWVLLANAAMFPASHLGSPYFEMARAGFYGFSVFGMVSAVLALLIAGMTATLAWRWLSAIPASRRVMAVAILPAIVLAWPLVGMVKSPRAVTIDARPHVVIIGLDSLRTDFVQHSGGAPYTPSIDEMVSEAAIFEDTITPLARTFPAWVSIVSGRHPHSTGAVINLFPRELIQEGETLPDLLRSSGYQTVYAIDEVRFSNLDTTYGFDQMIAPPIGAADFLIGFLHDLPLNNLLVNTWAGKFLFPFAHGNRGAALTYDPDTFVARLEREVRFEQPTLLAVHLTLSHWPYGWAGTVPIPDSAESDNMRLRYERSIRRLDEQVADVMDFLDEAGVLENAIVVLLSDHGESLGEPGRVVLHGEEAVPLVGHGTDVFSSDQYQVLLALRGYGLAASRLPGSVRIDAPASLEDIAPTITELLEIEREISFDGFSLAAFLQGDSAGFPDLSSRVRFIETEYNPPGFAIGQIPGTSQLAAAASTYSVDPVTDRLSIRPEMLGKVLSGRQFAALHDGAILAALPAQNAGGQYLVYLSDARSSPIWLTAAPDATTNPRVHYLWTSLSRRFETVRTRQVIDPAIAPAL